ncbi:hypothetical protein FBY23_5198 [Nocardioides sp. SLBN-35]|nr:hypothetical protein FBY23_5198 [Nocardioides sp. SLBN-35]
MTSRCIVRRKTGAFEVVDGFKMPTWATIHTDLPVRLAGSRGGTASSRVRDLAGAEIQSPVREAHVPEATDDLADGDLIEITAGENTGVVLRIVEATWQDQATARRLPVVGEARPKEWA